MTKKEERQSVSINIAQGLSLFILFIGVFLGALYAFGGSLLVAFPLSIVVLIGLYFFVLNLVAAKMERKRGGFSLGLKLSLILLLLLSIPISILVLHSINVEFFEKTELVTDGKEKIEVLGNLKKEFNAKYENYLSERRQAIIDNLSKYDNRILDATSLKAILKVDEAFVQSHTKGWPEVSAEGYIATERLKFLRADTSIFGNTKNYLDRQSRKIVSWNRFSINKAFIELETNINRTYTELNRVLIENTDGYVLKEPDPRGFKSNLLTSPIALIKKHFGLVHVGAILIIYFLLFLPYLIAPGRYYAKTKSKSKNDNLGGQAPTRR